MWPCTYHWWRMWSTNQFHWPSISASDSADQSARLFFSTSSISGGFHSFSHRGPTDGAFSFNVSR